MIIRTKIANASTVLTVRYIGVLFSTGLNGLLKTIIRSTQSIVLRRKDMKKEKYQITIEIK